MTSAQAINVAIKALQDAQRPLKGMAVYYRDFGATDYKPQYDRWRRMNEAIEVLQAMKEHR